MEFTRCRSSPSLARYSTKLQHPISAVSLVTTRIDVTPNGIRLAAVVPLIHTSSESRRWEVSVAVVTDPARAGMLPLRGRFSVLLMCADPIRRAAIVGRLRQFGAQGIKECANATEALTAARHESSRDMCIVDAVDADGPVLPVIAELRTLRWRRVLIVTPRDDAHAIRSAIAAGVRGFIVSGHSGSPRGIRGVVPVPRGRRSSTPDELSSRELEVLQSVAEGRSNKTIGEELGLSALTVKSHLARIARKLGTGDRAEMVALAMRSGLIR